ncbi:unnamed protein product [Zymoseptoria tritici ST99CH_1E4]|uniref:Granulins domain-containing protein n=1 Tax=Zymoseptoria tritici ST99CH_1E4 TaxID=1276532 RepID=A0A2H1H8K8_ZYMTR|nr:unnamed protein product [Zymoseptoria tritici ST99CH_1E4]
MPSSSYFFCPSLLCALAFALLASPRRPLQTFDLHLDNSKPKSKTMKRSIYALLAIAATAIARKPFTPCSHGERAPCPNWRCCHPFACGDDKYCHLPCDWGGSWCPTGQHCDTDTKTLEYGSCVGN